jgi:4-hydroxyphenylpyruvate dioxygenase-like putative hemolysin
MAVLFFGVGPGDIFRSIRSESCIRGVHKIHEHINMNAGRTAAMGCWNLRWDEANQIEGKTIQGKMQTMDEIDKNVKENKLKQVSDFYTSQ